MTVNKEKKRTTYPIGPLSYSRMLQALKEAMTAEDGMRGELKGLSMDWRLLCFHNFSSPNIHWYKHGGQGEVSRLTSIAYRNYEACLQIKTAAVVDDITEAHTHIGGYPNSKLLFRTVFSAGEFHELWFHFPCFMANEVGGVGTKTAQLRFLGTSHRIYEVQVNDNGIWRTVDSWTHPRGLWMSLPGEGLEVAHAYTCWHVAELIVDFKNNRYVNLKLNDEVYDLSDYSLALTPWAEPANLPVRYRVKTNDAVARYAWIGEVVILEVP